MLRKLTNSVTILPFDFRHITEFHGSCNHASFWFLACLRTSHIVQQSVLSTSKQSIKGCMPSSNSPRTKLGYDKVSSVKEICLLLSYPNFVRGLLFDDIQPLIGRFEILVTLCCTIWEVPRRARNQKEAGLRDPWNSVMWRKSKGGVFRNPWVFVTSSKAKKE